MIKFLNKYFLAPSAINDEIYRVEKSIQLMAVKLGLETDEVERAFNECYTEVRQKEATKFETKCTDCGITYRYEVNVLPHCPLCFLAPLVKDKK